MKIRPRFWTKGFVLLMSVLVAATITLSAKPEQPGPFEKFWRSVKHAFSGRQPQHKSTTHRTSHKSTTPTGSPSNAGPNTQGAGPNTQVVTADGVSAPPSEPSTRSTTRASAKRGEDLPYGTPVPGKQGFVTSPFSPNSGYIDVRGFVPGTPVKDPYTGKVFLTP